MANVQVPTFEWVAGRLGMTALSTIPTGVPALGLTATDVGVWVIALILLVGLVIFFAKRRDSPAKVRQEQRVDVAVRSTATAELDRVRSYVLHVHNDETAWGPQGPALRTAARKVLDEIEIFKSEVRLAEAGSTAMGKDGLAKLTTDRARRVTEYDRLAAAGLERATTAARLLQGESSTTDAETVRKALMEVRDGLTDSRNAYKGRRAVLMGVD